MIHLLTLLWLFEPAQPALSTLTGQNSQTEFVGPAATNSFTVKMTLNLQSFSEDELLLEIPEVLNIRLRHHDPLDRNRQNYPAFKMSDGSLPVLEATVVLHSTEHPDWRSMTVGLPIAWLGRPQGEHQVVVNFTGVRWTIYVDGRLCDNDFPFGYPQWPQRASWKIDPAFVTRSELYAPGIEPRSKTGKRTEPDPAVQYWTPPGHNTWVGDVVTVFTQGRYHVFYLFDRRHHQSKFGCGAHYFEHLSTTDFKTWTEHEAATPLEEQWECIGTGTPFVFNHQLCLSYGLHTTRVYPSEKTALPAQWDYLNRHGQTTAFRRDPALGFPAGSTYAVSRDGIAHFQKSQTLFHPCENPSVYVDPDGRLRMMANYHSRGIWESATVDGGWHCINPEFPPGGDCTFFFRWGLFDYVIGGFNGLWSKPASAPLSAFEDVVRKGLDFYDGLSVPAISEVNHGRFVLAAWLPVRGWGGVLVLRELLQYPDGRIGSKWMKEVIPPTQRAGKLSSVLTTNAMFDTGPSSFLLTCQVRPGRLKPGRLGIELLAEKGDSASTELQLRLDERRAQIGPGSLDQFAPPGKSLREGGSAAAVENLLGVDQPFTLRLVVQTKEKLGGSIVDAEIAGQRTLIAYRPGLAVRKIGFLLADAELEQIEIAPLKNP